MTKGTAPAEIGNVLHWVSKASVPLVALKDPATARRVRTKWGGNSTELRPPPSDPAEEARVDQRDQVRG